MSFTFRDNIEKMRGYTPGFQPDDPAAIKINTNENPFPPSPRVFRALARLDDEAIRRYPPVHWDEFRRVASDVHTVEPDQIICGNGGDELLTMLVRCCCDSNRPLAYPVPTYSLYPVLAAIQNCPTIEVPWPDDFHIPAELHDNKAALTILCNPNAPTGTFVPVSEVADLARQIEGVLAVDEAYVDFAEDNCLSLLREFDNVIILRSMSKGYSLAGLRFGYGIGSARIIEAMLKVKDSYNVNAATQTAAAAALTDRDYFNKNVHRIKKQRDRLTHGLRKLGFDVPDSHTNFLLCRPAGLSAQKIYEELTQRHIYIRYFNTEVLQNKLRITVGSAVQNDALLTALREILSVK